MTEGDKTVVALLVADAGSVYLPCQPLSSIKTDVYAKGEPALHAHMQLPKLGMQIVVVKVDALTSLQHELDLFGPMIASYRIAQARFDGRKDRDQSFFDFIALRQFTSQIFFA